MPPEPDAAKTIEYVDVLSTLPPSTAELTSVERPGDRVAGKFELLAELGRGGMGVVFLARQIDLDRQVALKMILGGALASDDQRRRFAAEAKAAAKLRHPNIVQVYETGTQANGQPYLAMQYIDGPNLANAVPQPLEDRVKLLATVARAVDHLHAHGIIHRDLKPSNILLDAAGRPYVTDFGLARLLEGDSGATLSGQVMGTPSYMAPEQALGRARAAGPTADVYALGAILYDLLTGRPPFRRETPFDTLLAVMEQEPEPPRTLNPAVPRELDELCLMCLEKEASRRPQSAGEVAAALEQFLKGEPIALRPGGWRTRLTRWAKREPALASRWAALALIAGVNMYRGLTAPETFTTAMWVQAVLLAWAVASWLCQRAAARRAEWAGYVWAAVDLASLSKILVLSDSLVSPIVVGYPVLIGVSGLWTRVALVWWTTGLAVAGYAAVVAHDAVTKGQLPYPHQHVIFGIALVTLGAVMAQQVGRLRALSRYYEGRP